jgi:hypothetical protein
MYVFQYVTTASRRLLTALGEDPDSEELLPLPVELHHA